MILETLILQTVNKFMTNNLLISMLTLQTRTFTEWVLVLMAEVGVFLCPQHALLVIALGARALLLVLKRLTTNN
jgi:hypothetical protein